MTTGFRISNFVFRVSILLCLCASAVAQQKLNGLELRRARDIQAELARAQAELPSATTALIQAQDAVTKEKSSAKSPAGPANPSAVQRRLAEVQRRADQANKRVPQLQARLADWESKTLKTHKADPTKFKVDWAAGTIVPK